jgi:hypothetical protein
MGNRMDALTYKMKSVRISSTIENLEVVDPLEKKPTCDSQLIPRDNTLENNPDHPDKSAEMIIIFGGEDSEKQTQSFAVDIVE